MSTTSALAEFSVRNRILVHLLFLLGVLGGLFAFGNSVVDVYPNVSFDAGRIMAYWPGASPEEIENAVTRKIEDEILDVSGLDRVVSNSERNVTVIDVKFREDLAPDAFERAFEELRAQVQKVDDLPADVDRPIVSKISVDEIFPLIQVAISADSERISNLTLRAVAKDLRQVLRTAPGVHRVSDIGLPEREWKIFVDPDALRAAGLDLLSVRKILAARHLTLPGGSLGEGKEVPITASGELRSARELEELVLLEHPDGSLRLGDVARIVDGLEKPTYRQRYQGRRAIVLSVAKRSDADSITTKGEVEKALAAFARDHRIPDEVSLATTMDSTQIIESRIRVLRDNMSFGVLLVFLTLWVFLGARNSFLALLGIPFSFLLGFIALSAMGISVNAITLFSLVLVSGMVVDDAIVVLENIHRRVEEGETLRDAVIHGSAEVALPVVASTLTTLAAFLPMLLMAGVTGEFMSIIPKTVAAVLIASLVECFVVLPAHYMHWGRRSHATRGRVDRLMDRVQARYRSSLIAVLKRPLLVVLAALLLAFGAGGAWTTLPTDLFPSDFQAFYCNVFLHPEYGLDATTEATREVEELFADLMPEQISSHSSGVGATFTDDLQLILKPHVSQVLVYISDEWGRDHAAAELIDEVRRRCDRLVAEDPEQRFLRIKVDSFKDGPPVGKPVAVRITAGDYDVGKSVSRQIQDALRAMPGVLSISDNCDEGPVELHILPDARRAAEAGVPFADLALLTLAAGEGIEIGEVVERRQGEEVTLRLQIDPESLENSEALESLEVVSPRGTRHRLDELAVFERRQGLSSRYHYDGERTVLVTADVDTEITDSATVNQALAKRFAGLEARVPGVRLAFGGEFEETQKSFESLKQAFVISVILIFTILAAQFRSYRRPLVVMVVVPFSFIGVVLGLWLLGFPLTIMAFIAIVGLSGVVVNDSLVLVDFIGKRHDAGGDAMDAIIESCSLRLRPVFLTTVTTVFGLLPMALGLTGYSLIWSPFAATITFGLTLAMFLTLYLVPAAYLLIAGRAAPAAD